MLQKMLQSIRSKVQIKRIVKEEIEEVKMNVKKQSVSKKCFELVLVDPEEHLFRLVSI